MPNTATRQPASALRPATRSVLCALLLMSLVSLAHPAPSRLKDLAVVNGLGRHKLLGYGLVAGLEGTGDGDNSLLTARSIANMLEGFGVTVSRGDFAAKNMAAVIVTAELPPVISVGATLDVTVSSLCDAKSLQGGTLLLTPLRAADSNVYAIAQGPVTIGGFRAETRGGDTTQKNHVTVGRVPGGASIVKALTAEIACGDKLSLSLLQPDFTTAVRLADTVNAFAQATIAHALDNTTVEITLPADAAANPVPFIVRLENLPVEPDTAARVVINERTGTVVIGQHVRINPVAVCHGSLTVEVAARTEVSQPPPLVTATDAAPPVTEPATAQSRQPRPPAVTGGKTVVIPQEDLQVHESGGALVPIPEQATLQDLVAALNALGVKPRDLIAIIQALKEARALQAELVLF